MRNSNHEASGSSGPLEGKLVDREVAFFAGYYGDQAYNLVGWNLRMERDLALLQQRLGDRPLDRVLSVGCGDGAFELKVAQHAGHVVGVDLSPEAIEIATRRATEAGVENVEFVRSSVADFEIRDSAGFDAILCIGFLHHLPESECAAFISEVYQKLAPGGVIYALDPNRRGFLRTIGRAVMGERYHRYHSPDERELDPDEVAIDLRAAGFQQVEVAYLDTTLVPATYILRGKPSWPLYFCRWFDRLVEASPFARWSSGYAIIATKGN